MDKTTNRNGDVQRVSRAVGFPCSAVVLTGFITLFPGLIFISHLLRILGAVDDLEASTHV